MRQLSCCSGRLSVTALLGTLTGPLARHGASVGQGASGGRHSRWCLGSSLARRWGRAARESQASPCAAQPSPSSSRSHLAAVHPHGSTWLALLLPPSMWDKQRRGGATRAAPECQLWRRWAKRWLPQRQRTCRGHVGGACACSADPGCAERLGASGPTWCWNRRGWRLTLTRCRYVVGVAPRATVQRRDAAVQRAAAPRAFGLPVPTWALNRTRSWGGRGKRVTR